MGWSPEFTARVERRDLAVGVVGLGYVGLPTALGFYEAGFDVRGFDVNAGLIGALRRGENPGEDPTITAALPSGEGERWHVSDDPAVLAGCDVCLVTVPTPVTTALLRARQACTSARASGPVIH